ncbi:hypothetical protein GC163_06940 [bacterium]|nr:hypothetical protein [bacterium]
MGRELIYSGLVAGMMCGCQSAPKSSCCDDCVPPKTYSYCPTYWQWKDEYITQGTAVKCANDDLKDLKKSCGKISYDFQDGYRQAYIDLSMGRPALTPTVPPSKYWNAYYRSCAGADNVADWFAGYQLGLERGQQGGISRFNRIATSWSNAGACPTAPAYSNGPMQGPVYGPGYAAAPTERDAQSRDMTSANDATASPAISDRYGQMVPVNFDAGETSPRLH